MQIEIPDLTLQRMYRAVEDSHVDEQRDYLGASIIGHECARYLYYSYNNYPRDPFNAKTLMTFESGHRSEDLAASRLRATPKIELITHNDDGEQYGFSDFDGKFKGHYDGAIRGISEAPRAWHIWEHKECNEKKFKEFFNLRNKHGYKMVLKEWNPIYYAQGQVYMHYTNLKRHFTTVSTMGGRDYLSCRMDYHKQHAEEYVRKAQMIIEATKPPQRISDNSDFFKCKWCDYRKECHG